MKSKKDISRLPKWAQFEFDILEMKNAELRRKLSQIENAHQLLCNPVMDWFTIGVHTPEKRKLYFLDKDHPNHVATIGAGSFVLIAHPKKPQDGI